MSCLCQFLHAMQYCTVTLYYNPTCWSQSQMYYRCHLVPQFAAFLQNGMLVPIPVHYAIIYPVTLYYNPICLSQGQICLWVLLGATWCRILPHFCHISSVWHACANSSTLHRCIYCDSSLTSSLLLSSSNVFVGATWCHLMPHFAAFLPHFSCAACLCQFQHTMPLYIL